MFYNSCRAARLLHWIRSRSSPSSYQSPMATPHDSNGTQGSAPRRKRPWRKPREAVGPGTATEPVASKQRVQADRDSGLRSSSSGLRSSPVQSQSSLTSGQTTDSGPGLVELDGSIMEGGGQILRNSMAMSCLLGRPVHITRIRAGRSTPGLRPQHLAGIQLISSLCGGRLEGDYVGSTEVTFYPQAIQGGKFVADTQTAGSICLLLQASLPCLLFSPPAGPSPSQVTLRGGTDAQMAPPIDYLTSVFRPIVSKFGVKFDCDLKKRGFFPRGGGEVVVTPSPVQSLSPVCITDPGHVTKVTINSFVAGAVPIKVAHQMSRAAKQLVVRQLDGVTVETNDTQEPPARATGNGSGIIAIAETSTGCLLAGSAIGRKGEPAERTGRSAAEELVAGVRAGGCVDEHLQDQLIVLMALACGKSVVRTGPVTLHTRTAIHVAELMTRATFTTRKLEGQDQKGEGHVIECTGIGLQNKHF